MNKKERFVSVCRENGLEIDDKKISLLELYVEELTIWNQKINLISRKDVENLWLRHILSSVSFFFKFSFARNSEVVDIGTGGGLPGIPIAIIRPDVNVALLDSINKKVKAVADIIKAVGIKNARTICGRAEVLSVEKEYKGTFDYVTARAVAPAEKIVKWCLPLLKKGNSDGAEKGAGPVVLEKGSIILWKGGDVEREIESASHTIKAGSISVYANSIEGGKDIDLFDKKFVIIKTGRHEK